jgi:hypothetical protein
MRRGVRVGLLASVVLGVTGTALAFPLPCTPANQRRGVCGCEQTPSGILCPVPGVTTPGPMAPPEDPEKQQQEQERQAHDLNDDGIDAFRRGDYDGAAESFRRARVLLDDPAIATNLGRARDAKTVVTITGYIATTQAAKNRYRAQVLERMRLLAVPEPTDEATLRQRLRERYAISVPTLPTRLREAREEALTESAAEAVWERLWELADRPLRAAGVDAEAMKTFADVERTVPGFARDQLGVLPRIVDALAKGSPQEIAALERLVTRNYCDFARQTQSTITPLPGAASVVERFLRAC